MHSGPNQAPFATLGQFFVLKDGSLARNDDPAHRDVLVVSAKRWGGAPELTLVVDERRLLDFETLQRSVSWMANESVFGLVDGNLLLQTGDHWWWVVMQWGELPAPTRKKRSVTAKVQDLQLLNWPAEEPGSEAALIKAFGGQAERALGMIERMKRLKGCNGLEAADAP